MSNELSDLFKLVAQEKKRKKEEIESLIGDSFEKLFIEQLQPKTKKEIKEEVKEETKIIKEEVITEGLLNILPTEKTSDPLTPLNQNFATLDDLQNHYKLFLNRIQQQLSTLGGGGETRLEFLDDVDRDSVKINNKFLKYNSSTGKWEGSNAGGGGPVSYATTFITSSSYTITENDYYIGVNYAGAVTITLPIVSVEGTTYIVKDELGEASKGTNRYITVLPSGSDTIDGRDRAILAYDFGSLTFVYRNGWRVV